MDRTTGEPIYRSIVWQDRRTKFICDTLRKDGHETLIKATTGLHLASYSSGTKLKWILNNVEGARTRAEKGDLIFGTVDSFLLWKFTGRTVHLTNTTNAARNELYDIHSGKWNEGIFSLLNIPMSMLPEVKDCAANFGSAQAYLFETSIPIYAVAVVQQAATVGQACFEPGMLKSTYGTGCFAILNTGATPVTSINHLLTTIAYQLGGKTIYALEGPIFIAGAVAQWLRDGLQIIQKAEETLLLAERADPTQKLILVPAFTGLGAPYWNTTCPRRNIGAYSQFRPLRISKGSVGKCWFSNS